MTSPIQKPCPNCGHLVDTGLTFHLHGTGHRPDCRCPNCRPDIHITHRDTAECERTGCGQATIPITTSPITPGYTQHA